MVPDRQARTRRALRPQAPSEHSMCSLRRDKPLTLNASRTSRFTAHLKENCGSPQLWEQDVAGSNPVSPTNPEPGSMPTSRRCNADANVTLSSRPSRPLVIPRRAGDRGADGGDRRHPYPPGGASGGIGQGQLPRAGRAQAVDPARLLLSFADQVHALSDGTLPRACSSPTIRTRRRCAENPSATGSLPLARRQIA